VVETVVIGSMGNILQVSFSPYTGLAAVESIDSLHSSVKCESDVSAMNWAGRLGLFLWVYGVLQTRSFLLGAARTQMYYTVIAEAWTALETPRVCGAMEISQLYFSAYIQAAVSFDNCTNSTVKRTHTVNMGLADYVCREKLEGE
jgi:hypothetical protein